MKPITKEWIEKAEGDWNTAQRELRTRRSPNYDAACFHAQQCAEKYLKARLQEAEVYFEKKHNLITLLDLALPLEPLWEALRPALRVLNAYAVEFRYPGESSTQERAKKAVALCRMVRHQARINLGLQPEE